MGLDASSVERAEWQVLEQSRLWLPDRVFSSTKGNWGACGMGLFYNLVVWPRLSHEITYIPYSVLSREDGKAKIPDWTNLEFTLGPGEEMHKN